MPGFTILKELKETPAKLKGEYTRVYLPKGTVCEGDSEPRKNVIENENENDYGGKYYRVSCEIEGNKYDNIDLYETEKGWGWQQTAGRRKNNRTAKKQRKNRRSSRHRARRLR